MERLAKRAIVLAVLLLIMPCAVDFARIVVRSVSRDVTERITWPDGIGTTVVTALVLVLFALGLVSRAGRALHGQGSGTRRRDRERRKAALAERRPAEDVPVAEESPPHAQDDEPDPDLPWNQEE